MAGITAMAPTSRQAGRSIRAEAADTGRVWAEIRALRGRIMVRSRMFAPRMLPTDRADCFLTMAVTVVTSSGRDVPIATMVTPMIR